MTTPVNFKLAQLLQDKNIKIYSDYRYIDFNGTVKLVPSEYTSDVFPYAPTIAEVVMWLYEKHGFWILVDWSQTKWCFSVIDIKEEVIKKASGNRWKERSSGVYLKTELDFNSPTKAYEDAIEYVLNNLLI